LVTNWKDVAVGSASTLVVTVVSGVALWYVTREAPSKPPAERLVYEIQKPADFQSSTTKLGLQTIRIANLGDAAASSVRAIVDYPAGVNVVDKAVSMSSGAVGGQALATPNPQRLEVSVPTLTPGESVTVSVLLSEAPAASPKVGVKSEKTVGSVVDDLVPPKPQPPSAVRDTIGRLLPFLLILQVPLALYFSQRFRRALRSIGGYQRSLNNTAFVLLHQGLTADASRVLRRAIAAGEADANVFSNQALCYALEGNHDAADKALAAAEFFDRTGAAGIVLSFNRAFVALVRKDYAAAKEHLVAALAGSPSEVRRWCQHSSVFKEYAAGTEDVKALVLGPKGPDNNQSGCPL